MTSGQFPNSLLKKGLAGQAAYLLLMFSIAFVVMLLLNLVIGPFLDYSMSLVAMVTASLVIAVINIWSTSKSLKKKP